MEARTVDRTNVQTSAASGGSTRNFIQHFLEMVMAMVAGMAVLGGALSLGFAIAGHGNPVHYAALRALVMTVNMTIGMAVWMRHRGHNWVHIGEMTGAMFLPLAVLVYPFWAGLLQRGALLGGMHVLMLPSMLGVMLYRRDVYAQDHRGHSPGHPPHPSAGV